MPHQTIAQLRRAGNKELKEIYSVVTDWIEELVDVVEQAEDLYVPVREQEDVIERAKQALQVAKAAQDVLIRGGKEIAAAKFSDKQREYQAQITAAMQLRQKMKEQADQHTKNLMGNVRTILQEAIAEMGQLKSYAVEIETPSLLEDAIKFRNIFNTFSSKLEVTIKTLPELTNQLTDEVVIPVLTAIQKRSREFVDTHALRLLK